MSNLENRRKVSNLEKTYNLIKAAETGKKITINAIDSFLEKRSYIYGVDSQLICAEYTEHGDKTATLGIIDKKRLLLKIKKLMQEQTPQTPRHYEQEGEKQIWDFFHLLDGHQANILKYLDRAGRKQGETFDKDISKAIDYARKAKETSTPVRKDISGIVVQAVNIARHIDCFQDDNYAEILAMVLCKEYATAIVFLNLMRR